MKRKPAKRKPKLEPPRTVSVAYLDLPDWRERLTRVLHIVAPDLVGELPADDKPAQLPKGTDAGGNSRSC
jgi:hypothetical protein